MRVSRIKLKLHTYAPAALLVLIILAVWETGVRFGGVPAFILPAPSAVWIALVEQRGLLLSVHLPATLQEILLGFLLAAGCGTLLGLGMHLFPPLAKAVYPLLIVSQTIPLIALSPILIMWFGYTLGGKIAVVFLTAFFPVVVSTYDGLHKSGEQYKELLLTLGASRRQLLVKTQIPLALPSYFSGLEAVHCLLRHWRNDRRMARRQPGPRLLQPPDGRQSAQCRAVRCCLSALRAGSPIIPVHLYC